MELCVALGLIRHDCNGAVKGTLCSFGENILIRRQISSLTEISLCPNKSNKQTLFVIMTEQTE